MKALQDFLLETQSLRFKHGLDLSEYDKNGGYATSLKKLQQEALTEILQLSTEQLDKQMARIDMINSNFEKAWDLWVNWSPGEISFQQVDAMRRNFISEPIKFYPVPKNITPLMENALDAKSNILLSFKEQVLQASQSSSTQIDPFTVPLKTGDVLTITTKMIFLYFPLVLSEKLSETKHRNPVKETLKLHRNGDKIDQSFKEVEEYLSNPNDYTSKEKKTWDLYRQQLSMPEVQLHIKNLLQR